MKDTVKNLEALRDVMRRNHVDAMIIPGTDPHQSEYISAHWKLRDWATGFTGSNGTAVVTLNEAGLWTDSRYFLQAEMELAGTGIVMYKEDGGNDQTVTEWLASHLEEDSVVAINGRLFSVVQAGRLEAFCGENGFRLATDFDPFPAIYTDRPELPLEPIYVHEEKYAGENVRSKVSRIMDACAVHGADATLLSALDEVAWTFNIRCADIEFNPVAIAYAYVSDGDCVLFVDERKVNAEVANYLHDCGVKVASYDSVEHFLEKLKNKTVLLDPNKTSDTIARSILNCSVVYAQSPVALMKAVKNEVQLEGVRRAMERDGVALVKLYMWLEENVASEKLTEIDVAEMLVKFRAESPLYKGESFAAACGYNAHGAIVHYEAKEASASVLKPEGLLLFDTGAQYLDGTTDITRTVALGNPTDVQRRDYTLVLKGHVALAKAVYPAGTRGSQLDALARQFLWQNCMTYWHGTGHGVGHFLNVHEGPQNFRLNENPTVLVANMITSDEPGLYKTGEYGIRIENLILSRNCRHTEDFGDFMDFETLTLCPYDSRLIDMSILTDEETAWIDSYHAMVYDRLSPYLDEQQKEWLKNKTKPLKK